MYKPLLHQLIDKLSIFDSLLEGFQIIDRDFRYVYVNETVAKQGKTTTQQLMGKTMMECYPGIENSPLFEKLRSCMFDRKSFKFENEFIYPDGSKEWFELSIEPIEDGIFILSVDINEKKKAELELIQLKNSLEEKVKTRTRELERINKEKDVILKEMHHRVKNNLQLISSLINLQSAKGNNAKLTAKLTRTKERIETIARIHESLYRHENLAFIDTEYYLKTLLEENIKSFDHDNGFISFSINLESHELTVDRMVPLGLLVNELVTNSLCLAFKPHEKGEIHLSFQLKGNEFELVYMDSGVGYDESSPDFTERLGSFLINGFVEQLDGSLKKEKVPKGVKFVLRFPEK
ncbi:MAG: PAS domain-containing protein [Bacteroidetes bacterium]|nr:MAG: PAS domain-containing protein [Bacteroidota bacterium]